MRVSLRSLATGARFRFPFKETEYEYRGSGWYGTPAGFDGGPWHLGKDGDREVSLISETVPISSLALGDVVRLSSGEEAYSDATVYRIDETAGTAHVWRPYVQTADFSMSGPSVIPYIGLEDFALHGGPVVRIRRGDPLR